MIEYKLQSKKSKERFSEKHCNKVLVVVND